MSLARRACRGYGVHTEQIVVGELRLKTIRVVEASQPVTTSVQIRLPSGSAAQACASLSMALAGVCGCQAPLPLRLTPLEGARTIEVSAAVSPRPDGTVRLRIRLENHDRRAWVLRITSPESGAPHTPEPPLYSLERVLLGTAESPDERELVPIESNMFVMSGWQRLEPGASRDEECAFPSPFWGSGADQREILTGLPPGRYVLRVVYRVGPGETSAFSEAERRRLHGMAAPIWLGRIVSAPVVFEVPRRP